MNTGPEFVEQLDQLFKECTSSTGEQPGYIILPHRFKSRSQSHRRKLWKESKDRCARGMHRTNWWSPNACRMCGGRVEKGL